MMAKLPTPETIACLADHPGAPLAVLSHGRR
jgi:hypothetical protein